MPAVIDQELCISCGKCDKSCPLDVIHFNLETEITEVIYPEECWHCGSCRQVCPEKAISIRFPLRILVCAGTSPY